MSPHAAPQTVPSIVQAVALAVVGAIRGTRLLWDAIDDLTVQVTGLGQSWDPGEDEYEDEDLYLPEYLTSDR